VFSLSESCSSKDCFGIVCMVETPVVAILLYHGVMRNIHAAAETKPTCDVLWFDTAADVERPHG